MFVVQANMQAQEDLAALFSQNLTLDSRALPEPVRSCEDDRIVYVSAHYNHSAHVVHHDPPAAQHSPRPASEPPQLEHSTVETLLRSHGVDPTVLSAAQVQLFKTVEEPQQRRLLDLWRECPPANSNDNPTLAWCTTTMEQEELFARMRYERRLVESHHHQMVMNQTIMSMDGTPLTPVQAGDGRWISTANSPSYVEPYVATGYEELARREYEESARRAYADAPAYKAATDPVYALNAAVGYGQHDDMADRYGRMVQTRNDDEEML